MKHDVEKVVPVQPNKGATNGMALNHLRYPPTRVELGLPWVHPSLSTMGKKETTTTPTTRSVDAIPILCIPHLVDGGHLLQELGQAWADPHVVV